MTLFVQNKYILIPAVCGELACVYELTDRSCVRPSVRAAGYRRRAGEVGQLVELLLRQS